ncbi:hypothetical protein SAMN05216203_2791 [Marinobacter daqiaonensis]|uniref:Uncharacterized protein n=1 Tax=Marinobacter daqiaonensis TaxID=650891 RepID=A0A1I6J911_9GAMM|nr:hypothetical protein SAMN05216203_2791 [Marinobacter daqiaonensis]
MRFATESTKGHGKKRSKIATDDKDIHGQKNSFIKKFFGPVAQGPEPADAIIGRKADAETVGASLLARTRGPGFRATLFASRLAPTGAGMAAEYAEFRKL